MRGFTLVTFLLATLTTLVSYGLGHYEQTLNQLQMNSIGKINIQTDLLKQEIIVVFEIVEPDKVVSLFSDSSKIIHSGKYSLSYQRGYIFWSQNISDEKLEKHKMNFFKKSKLESKNWLIQLFIPTAHAQFQPSCEQSKLSNALGLLNLKIQSFSFLEVMKKCEFNFENLIDQQMQSLKETLVNLENVTLAEFIDSIVNAFSALYELIPQINLKVILPLEDLIQKAPPVAQKLICDFTQQKVGDIFLAASTGGVGMLRIAPKLALDVSDFANKIFTFTNNGTVAFFVHELNRRNLLTDESIARLTKLERDFPAGLKNKVRNKFHGFNDHQKLAQHVELHRREMGFKSTDAYLDAAHNFAKRVDKDNVAFEASNGDSIKWNSKTDEFVVLDSNGFIKSYYFQNCEDPSDKLRRLIQEKAQCKPSKRLNRDSQKS